ncbi:hypothetical protein K474DRAFT_1656805 [Panus rudis PR-1116 ss-1]|nr:hypothetical protein K474DRAFT_1656805 [Panus rudis PR-1116 ss-1]
MFRTLSQSSFRRSIHTAASRSTRLSRPTRIGAVLGASAAVTAYLAWNSHKIALDSPQPSSSTLNAKNAASPDALKTSDPVAIHHEPSLSPKSADPSASSSTSDESTAAPEGEGEKQSGAGGAFNPETGEINWDCPCLGGMAHGPCGLQFREAFSCFVFSEQEPKGIDCVEKFKAMQDCFREHPDVYGDDIMDDDDDDEAPAVTADDSSSTEGSTLRPDPNGSIPQPVSEETTAA